MNRYNLKEMLSTLNEHLYSTPSHDVAVNFKHSYH